MPSIPGFAAPGYEGDHFPLGYYPATEGPVPVRRFTWRDVPERPLLQGQWWSQTWWLGQMSSSAFNSAAREGVFDTSRVGPRGGARFAVLDMAKWTAWRKLYQERAHGAELARAKMKALRAMGCAKPR